MTSNSMATAPRVKSGARPDETIVNADEEDGQTQAYDKNTTWRWR